MWLLCGRGEHPDGPNRLLVEDCGVEVHFKFEHVGLNSIIPENSL